MYTVHKLVSVVRVLIPKRLQCKYSMAKRTPQKKTVFTKKLDPPFECYWTQHQVQTGLKRDELIQGSIRINQKNYEEAYVNDPAGGPDFFISGMMSRNRALNDDCVVIQVAPIKEWITTNSDSALKLKENATNTASLESKKPPQPLSHGNSLVDRLYAPIPVKDLTSDPGRKQNETVPNNVRRTAKVVYIGKKVHSRASAGYIRAYDKVKKLALFSPRDNRIPRIFVPLEDCPQDFITNMKKYDKNLFISHIDNWPEDSPLPYGRLMRSLGEAGLVEGESEAFLVENEVDYSPFPDEVLACLPTQLPWTAPPEEIHKRRDFRQECVVTIDPDTARDLDDALHVKQLEDGTMEVGVHIADVSHFVTGGTALDKFASQRATSVYLVQKVIPMLPRLLCEQLCSLNPNEDRLTFSVVWTLTNTGEFISEWFGKSIIHSCAKLSYDHAQLMIEGEKSHDSFPEIYGGFTTEKVAECVCALNKLAVSLRQQRQSKGTLRLDQVKLKYSIDSATGLPSGCQPYVQKESNRMIEEFMLMANMAVARKCHSNNPEVALLRRHPPPKPKATEILTAKLQELGIELDTRTAGSIQESLDNYRGCTSDPFVTEVEKLVLVSQCSKIMDLAKYFCAGSLEMDKYSHYALNVPFYTHFTSPIRRYADIIVHRQLASALGEGPSYTMRCDDIQQQAMQCNKKKKSAKIVEELSSELFLTIMIKECGPFETSGMVTLIQDKAFDVFIRDFGVVKRVYCDKLPLQNFTFASQGKEHCPQLTLEWQNPAHKETLRIFSLLKVSIQSGKNPLQYEVTVHPTVIV